MKKILSIILCLALVLSLTVMASAAEVTTGQYAIVAEYDGKYIALGNDLNKGSNKVVGVEVTVENGNVSGDNIPTWTVTAVDGGVTLSNANGTLTHPKSTNIDYSDVTVWGVEDKGNGKVWFTDGTRAVALRFYKEEFIFGAYATSNATHETYSAEYSFDLQLIPVAGEPSVPTEPTPTEPAVPTEPAPTDAPVVLPPDGSTLTIPEANEIGAKLDSNAYTTEMYYITGTITEIANTKYGNMYIQDEAGNSLYIYGLNSADGSVRYDSMDPQPVVGDTITILTVIGNYKGSPQAKAAQMTALVPGNVTPPAAPSDPKEIVDAAFALEVGKSLPYEVTLTGKIVEMVADFDASTKGVHCYIEVEGTAGTYNLLCYWVKPAVDFPGVLDGDETITVTGTITNYNGLIEFTSSSTYTIVEDPNGAPPPSTGEYVIVAQYNGKFYAMGSVQNDSKNKLVAYEVTVENGVASGDIVPVWTVTIVDGGVTISNESGYVIHSGSTKIEYGAEAFVWNLEDKGEYNYLTSSTDANRGLAFRHYEKDNGVDLIFGGYATSNIDNDQSEQYSFELLFCAKGASTGTEPTPTEPTPTEPAPTEPKPEEVIVPIADGSYVFTWNGKTFAAIAEDKTYGYAPYGDAADLKNTDVFVITNTADGKFTITDCYGRLVYMKGTFKSFNVGTDATEGTEWVLVDAGNGTVYLKNVEKGKYVSFSEEFSTWGCYADPADSGKLTYAVQSTEPAPTDPTPTEPAPTEPAPTEPAPTEPTPTEPAPTEPAPSQPDITTGEYVLIAEYNGKFYAMGSELNAAGNKLIAYEVTVSNGVVTGDVVPYWTVTAVEGGVTISNESGYVIHSGSTKIEYGAEAFVWNLEDKGDFNYLISSTDATRGLSFRNYKDGPIFGAYSTSNIDNDYSAEYSFKLVLNAKAGSGDPTPTEPITPTEPTPGGPSATGDAIAVVVALLAVASLGITVIGKKKF